MGQKEKHNILLYGINMNNHTFFNRNKSITLSVRQNMNMNEYEMVRYSPRPPPPFWKKFIILKKYQPNHLFISSTYFEVSNNFKIGNKVIEWPDSNLTVPHEKCMGFL